MWCSIDSYFQNRKAQCEVQCPLLARKLVQNYPNSIHSSCLARDPKAISLIPTSIEITQILSLHNYIRSQVSPTATDLNEISWVHF